jgi:predicted secreted protein
MLKKIALLVFIPCLAVFSVFFWSIPCEAGWFKTYGGTGNDSASFIQQTPDGGYIMAGDTTSFGAGNRDIWLLKLDGEGSATWQKTYGGTGREWIESIQQTPDGGYIVAGHTPSFGAGGGDAWIIKLDGSGNVTWQRTYGGTALDFAGSIRQTSDEGYIVAGYTESFGAGERDGWLFKLDGDGNVSWQKTYGGTGNDYAGSVLQTSDGYIVVGQTESFGAGGGDAWIMKLNVSGNVAWQKTYGGTGYDSAWSVLQTSDGYIVAGDTESFGAGGRDAWLMKLDGSGNVTWQKTYGGAKYDSNFSIQKIQDGGYIMVGSTQSFGAGNDDDAWFFKLDENGSANSCPFERISTAIVSDTAVTVTETAAITGTTSVTGVDTTIVPVDSDATSSEICPFSGDFRLKVGATRKRQGDGTITSLDGLINCPDACQTLYTTGITTILTATPSPLSTFLGWKPTPSGCETPNPVCQITMDEKKSVKAIFQGPSKLKVVTTFKNGATGTVTSGDALINCPGDCEEPYILNAPVTLTANEGIGSKFVKWTGKPCKDESTNVCTFEMSKNATVKAIFEVNP